jgi:hypothetical protein
LNIIPFAVKIVPYSPERTVVILENCKETGLNCPTLEFWGPKSTFPVGKRTPPVKFPDVNPVIETFVNEKFVEL